MADKQLDQMEKLWETTVDLLGDIMALENFCRCQEQCVIDFGTRAALAYVRRIQADAKLPKSRKSPTHCQKICFPIFSRIRVRKNVIGRISILTIQLHPVILTPRGAVARRVSS